MSQDLSRRNLLKTGVAVSAAAMAMPSSRALAAGSDTMGVAAIGCGGRGTYDIINCLNADRGVQLVAIAELFPDRVESALAQINKKCPGKAKVTPETTFLGFDAYKKVLAMPEVDMVMLLTPPGFRPMMVRAAIEAGKHIFMEKPGGVDPVGIRSMMESHEMANQRKLSIVVGTQQRRQPQYIELVGRVRDGKLGDIVGGQAWWNWGHANWHFQKRKPEWSDMEWQIRCWPYFVWLSGDHIVEQHLHNMDVINWAVGSPPVSALAVGGRQVRTGPEYGNIFDHFGVEFLYPNGIRVLSMASQIEGSTPRVGERVQCTKGAINTTRGDGFIEDTRGNKIYTYDKPIHSGEVAEFADLIKSIRTAQPINECRQLAESTLTVILGRMSAYTGRAMKYDWALKSSKLDLSQPKLEMGDLPVRPLPIPGRTPPI